MSADKRYFEPRIRQSIAYMEYSSALDKLPGYDSVEQHKNGQSLFVYTEDRTRVFSRMLPTDDFGVEKVLYDAAAEIYAYIRSEQAKFDSAVSQAVIAFSDVEGLDARADFQGAMTSMLQALRERCEMEGWDFDAMSRDPAFSPG